MGLLSDLDCNKRYFNQPKQESHPAVSAILFVYIHPYMDGNGSVGRFTMNMLLASGGYPRTIILVANRKAYLDSHEETNRKFVLENFTHFVYDEMNAS